MALSIQIPPKSDNLLEEGYWQASEPELNAPVHVRATKWCVDLVRPSILLKEKSAGKKLRRTAYLDGLRGFAALLVYCGHHQLRAHESLPADVIFENAFGYNKQYYFACLPGIRTFFSGGHFAVTVFFVISGYVLSAKPLALIHAGEHTKLGDNLASALFRRWPRLHIPVLVTTFLYMTSWHAFGLWADHPPQPTYRAEVWKWYTEVKNFSFIFRTGGEVWITYNFHVWSIPVEMRGSVVIYTALLAFSRCTKNARLWCTAGLIFYFMYIVDGWFCSMFVSGMLLCDLDLLAASNDLPAFFKHFDRFKSYIFYGLFVISMYLGGVPSYSADTDVLKKSFGWHFLSYLKPQAVFDYKWFFLLLASTSLVASIPRIPCLKAFFEHRINQYLGRVSYAFYLLHGPVMWILGDRLYAAVGWSKEAQALTLLRWINILRLPRIGPLGLELNFLLPHLFILPVTLWLAELATKLLDEPSVRFSQWAYEQTLGTAGENSKGDMLEKHFVVSPKSS